MVHNEQRLVVIESIFRSVRTGIFNTEGLKLNGESTASSFKRTRSVSIRRGDSRDLAVSSGLPVVAIRLGIHPNGSV